MNVKQARKQLKPQMLGQCYSWTAHIGMVVVKQQAHLKAQFNKEQKHLAEMPMQQAYAFQFMLWLETRHPKTFVKLMQQAIDQGPEHWAVELDNTVDWYTRPIEVEAPLPL